MLEQFFKGIKFFTKDEFMCPCGCNRNFIDIGLVFLIDNLRRICGFPIIVNSACRCESHNVSVGGSPTSSHKKGLAIDIKVHNDKERFIIVQALLRLGIVRIGIYKDFIHIDIDMSKTQNVIWHK